MKEGRKAPAFKLADQDGNIVSLSDFVGRTVVLYFYPKAGTPGCTAQACAIRDRFDDYDAAGALVVGISRDDPAQLREFADEHDLPFTLLVDGSQSMSRRIEIVEVRNMRKPNHGNVEVKVGLILHRPAFLQGHGVFFGNINIVEIGNDPSDRHASARFQPI